MLLNGIHFLKFAFFSLNPYNLLAGSCVFNPVSTSGRQRAHRPGWKRAISFLIFLSTSKSHFLFWFYVPCSCFYTFGQISFLFREMCTVWLPMWFITSARPQRKLLVCYTFSPRGVPPLFRLCLEHREVPLVIGVIKMKHFCKMKTTAACILMYMLPDEKECH